ncbi:MAG TPA: hypothetical protein VK168_12135 [Saprospiraceae bacterium]|nr:hypothetical protein [Saprospiraceae bacterium]
MKKQKLMEAFEAFKVSSKDVKGGYRVYGLPRLDLLGNTWKRYTEYDDWNCETGTGDENFGKDPQ